MYFEPTYDIIKNLITNPVRDVKMLKKYIGTKQFYKSALLIAVPIMVQNGITNFVSMLDNIMVGSVGTVEMAGVSIANTIMFVFNLAIFGAVSGAGIFGAQFFGKGDEDGLRQTFRFKLLACALLSVVGIVVFRLFGESLIGVYLRGEGDVEDIAASLAVGTRYLHIMLLGIPPFVLVQSYAGTLRETRQTALPMKAGIAAVTVNLVFNWLLIFGNLGLPRLNAEGAAIATVLSRYVEAAIVVIWTHCNKEKNPFAVGLYLSFRISPALAKRITVKALPLLINETLWAFGQAILTQCYSYRGYDVVSATTICSTVTNVCNVAFLSMGAAIGIIVGQLLGAGKSEEAIDTDRKLIVFTEAICLFFVGILAGISGLFPKLYRTSDAIRSLASSFILIAACMMPFNAFSNASYFTLRSGGRTFITFLFDSVYACLVAAPIAYVLSRFTPIPIVWLYFITQFTEFGKCIIGFLMIRSRIWVQNIVTEEANPI